MSDPFDSLRRPDTPAAPRPEFAAQLRARIAATLQPAPKETTPVPEIREYTPARLTSVVPYLCCTPADEALDWYVTNLDAVVTAEPVFMPDGKVGHSEIRFGSMVVFLADEYEPEGVRNPADLGGNSVSLMLYVPDVAATTELALANGATLVRPLGEAHGQLGSVIRDPFGHRWMLATALEPDDLPIEDTPGRRFGDIGYVTMSVPDGARSMQFFAALFGWQGHASQPGGFHIDSLTPPGGIATSQGEPEVRLYFRVDDIDTTAARVAELGGEVLSTTTYASGGNAECRDPNGLRFDLFRPRPGY